MRLPAPGPRLPVARVSAVALLLCCAAALAQDGLPDIPAEVFDLLSPKQGPTWVALTWDSTALKHDVRYGEIKGHNLHALKFETIRDVYSLGYSVIGLKPETRYEFLIRAYPVRGGPAVESAPITVQTRPSAPREFSGLMFWPERPLGTFRRALTEACIEGYKGQLYVLEVVECHLHLSCVDPETFAVRWTREITPRIDEDALCYLGPDACIHEDRLWITWYVQKRGADPTSPASFRQRLMFFDLSPLQGSGQPEQPEQLVSAVMEITPSRPGRGTRQGSVCSYLGGLWLSWLEEWVDEDGRTKATLRLAPYEPWRGRLGDPVEWTDCPTDRPHSVSVANYGGRLVLLFTTDAQDTAFAGSEYLMFAQFDGKRFYDVRTLRRLGANRNGRGVQLYERFYFVYDTDANYLGAVGSFRDIAVGRLVPFERLGAGKQGYISALPHIIDMKHNSTPDITTLGDAMYTVCSKQDRPASLTPGAQVRGFGTYIAKITRTVTESLSEF